MKQVILKSLLFAFLSLFLFIQATSAQSKGWLPGKVTFKDGKQLNGKVDYGAWAKNPKRILFTDTANIQYELTPVNASVVEITGRDIYYAASVTRYMNSLDVNELKDASYETDKELTEAVFLRELTRGKLLTLYSYKDEIKHHYFIKDKKDSIISLRYKLVFNTNSMQVQADYYFREQLLPYVFQNDKAEMQRRTAGWRNDDLIKTVKLINGNFEPGFAEIEAQKLKKENSLFAGAGMAFISFNIRSDERFWGKYNFASAASFFPYAGYRLSARRNIPSLKLQFLIGGYGYNTSGIYRWTNEQNQNVIEFMTVEYKNFVAGTEGLMVINKQGNFRGEAGIGINVNLSFQASSRNTTNETRIDGSLVGRDQFRLSQTTNLLFHGVVQGTYIKKHTVRLSFRPMQKIDNTSNSRPREQMFLIGYHYSFIKKN